MSIVAADIGADPVGAIAASMRLVEELMDESIALAKAVYNSGYDEETKMAVEREVWSSPTFAVKASILLLDAEFRYYKRQGRWPPKKRKKALANQPRMEGI